MYHFQFNTIINGIDFSAKSVGEVELYIKNEVDGYELKLFGKDNIQEKISGSAISLTYMQNGDVKKELKKQNPFVWIFKVFTKKSTEIDVKVKYNEEVLNKKIEELNCLQIEKKMSISAEPKFDGEKYVIAREILGTEVDKEILNRKIHEFIGDMKPELNMENEVCYKLPDYTSESDEVIKAVELLNAYCKASITYDMKSVQEIVDKKIISEWLTWDTEMNVTFNQQAVSRYMEEFGKKYDTVGSSRTIVTPSGKNAEVNGGTYGWAVDEAGEVQALTASIKNGEVVTREPLYVQTAATHEAADWGNTYVEVDLSAQYMWFLDGGSVILETDIVTGEPIPEKITPEGVYSILEKELNKTLIGEIVPGTGKPEYEQPVYFWMRATWSGIGFHDAGWQTAFGDSLNQIAGVGSHGCINMPYDKAAQLYDMLPVGTPVIIHY